MHLQLLRALLPRMSAREVAAYVQSKPTSAYARRIWYLFEEFTGRCLNLEDVNQGNYVDLLNSQDYYTGPAVRSPRHRVHVNLLGSIAFSPLVRRTKKLKAAEGKRLEELCRTVISGIPPELHARALQYLYTKETKSSYAIERETPDQRRAQKFADALREASLRDYLLKETLVAQRRRSMGGVRLGVRPGVKRGERLALGLQLPPRASEQPPEIPVMDLRRQHGPGRNAGGIGALGLRAAGTDTG